MSFSCYAHGLDRTADLDPPIKAVSRSTCLLVEEARLSCTAGMLLCLDREQRLIYILGEIFEVRILAAVPVSLILSSVGRISWPATGPTATASSTAQITSPDFIDTVLNSRPLPASVNASYAALASANPSSFMVAGVENQRAPKPTSWAILGEVCPL